VASTLANRFLQVQNLSPPPAVPEGVIIAVAYKLATSAKNPFITEVLPARAASKATKQLQEFPETAVITWPVDAVPS